MSDPLRLQALQAFAETALDHPVSRPLAASSDASFRSYWRLHAGRRSFIVMDAPPQHEDCRPFIDVAARLAAIELDAPRVLASDLAQGFLLLTDLGRRTYLPELDAGSVEVLYGDALAALLRLQTQASVAGLPLYDEARLLAELELLPAWFLRRHLGWQDDCEGLEQLERAWRLLLDSALEQPRSFVHRDYHSRNLMILDAGGPGILDFQDAVLGPLSYDLVSLLKDCYITWPRQQVLDWAERHRQALAATRMFALPDPARWRRWFDLMGLQRHLKVLGIFCRLWYRDGKPGYLADLPRVLAYVLETCAEYPELQGFGQWLQRLVGGRQLERPRT